MHNLETLSDTKSRLKSFIERIERLEAEKTALSEDLKEVYAEIKGVGYDAPTIRRIVKERKKDDAETAEKNTLYCLYAAEIGMTPIEQWVADSKPKLAAV